MSNLKIINNLPGKLYVDNFELARFFDGMRLEIDGVGSYHCMSRIVGGQRLLGKMEKEVFRSQLHKLVEFCGLEMLTYCIMSNHFHVLVRVSDETEVSDEVLLRRVVVIYGQDSNYVNLLRWQLKKNGELGDVRRNQLLARMNNISIFMKELKQRFSIWYNKSHGRFGTLWADRFKCVLVENRRYALETVAAYIDLNPVRGGLVVHPEEYRYCGYGEAMGGSVRARTGIEGFIGESSWTKSLEGYRQALYGKESVSRKMNDGSLDVDRVKVILKNKGKVSQSEILRCRVRYFTEGLIIGSESFIQRVVDRNKSVLSQKRKGAGKSMAGSDWGKLMSYRELKKDVFC
tara:strand:- start:20 stop:1057 length:1038 start_codon:yes stop_codon:yes gene_type:complete